MNPTDGLLHYLDGWGFFVFVPYRMVRIFN